MTATLQEISQALPVIHVDVVEPGMAARPGTLHCVIDEYFWFDTAGMESYFFAQWEPVLYDAFLLAAAVEFCDITQRRPAHGWGRNIYLRLPVHHPERWQQEEWEGRCMARSTFSPATAGRSPCTRGNNPLRNPVRDRLASAMTRLPSSRLVMDWIPGSSPV
jgi:hypothetical protein